MLAAICAAAPRRQATPLVAIVVERNHQNWLAHDGTFGGQRGVLLEGLPKCPELFLLAVCVHGDFVDQLIQGGWVQPRRLLLTQLAPDR